MTTTELWNDICEKVKPHVKPDYYELFFAPCFAIDEESIVIVSTDLRYVRKTLRNLGLEHLKLESKTDLDRRRAVEMRKIEEAKMLQEDPFKLFWSIYPRKRSKEDAFKAWNKIPPLIWPTVIEGLKKQLGWKQFRKEKEFIPFPATWLNGRRWEDQDE